ncbi:kinase-like domain-containing protein [Ampelomyces quisqualis]|uniref:non-specific serine/threonine protein kinase n=1 Tax=Ampelomyces quisqualis TaxID=50730 RepID=A0A6A5QTG7_AMPQU|nr:kinase-like domain-containing protein [Ampelomyces quisqualis]
MQDETTADSGLEEFEARRFGDEEEFESFFYNLEDWDIDPEDNPGVNHAAAYLRGRPNEYGMHYEALPGAVQSALISIGFEVERGTWFAVWYSFILNTMYADDRMGDKYDEGKMVGDRWTIVSKLGGAEGSFNLGIYIVKNGDGNDEKQGVLKLLSTEAMEPGIARREVSILALLQHPNIVELHQSDIPDHHHDTPWIVAEHCDRGTVAHLVRRYKDSQQPVPDLFAWQILNSLAQAVHYCHHGPLTQTHDDCSSSEPWDEITHRDIILSNIFIQTSNEADNEWEYPVTVKLGDWGCAISQSEWTNGGLKVTDLPTVDAAYKPPEAALPAEATDIYQIGLVMGCIYRTADQPDEHWETWSSSMLFPEQLLLLIASCLATEPGERPTARDLINAVQLLRDTCPVDRPVWSGDLPVMEKM